MTKPSARRKRNSAIRARAFLGIDLGTSRIKVGLFDAAGRRLGLGSREAPPFLGQSQGFREFEIEDSWGAFAEALHEALRPRPRGVEVGGIGFSSQAQTFTAFDADGKPLRPAISWLDDRAMGEAAELREEFGTDTFYRLSGLSDVSARCLAAKILWLRRHEPEVSDLAATFAQLRDWFIFRLTGAFTSDPTLPTLGGIFDRFQGRYWKEMLERAEVEPDRLPRIVRSEDPCGTVTPDAAAELGLPEGIPVVPGCLDQIASAAGVGNLEPGMVSANVGSVITIFFTRAEPSVDPGRRMLAGNHVLAGRYFLMPYIQAAGLAVDWFRSVFAPGMEYAALEEEAEQVPPGTDGLIFIPHLSGCFSPEVHPNARGLFANLTLGHTRGHLYRGVLEGIAFALRENLELLADFGTTGQTLRLFGGGASSPFWTRIIADVTGRTIERPGEPEASCLGAAMLAAVGAGHFPAVPEAAAEMVRPGSTVLPDPENRIVYDRAYDQFRAFERDTFPQGDD